MYISGAYLGHISVDSSTPEDILVEVVLQLLICKVDQKLLERVASERLYMQGGHWVVIGWSSGRHWVVVGSSLGRHWVVILGGHRVVIRRSENGHQVVIRPQSSHNQAVIKSSSVGHHLESEDIEQSNRPLHVVTTVGTTRGGGLVDARDQPVEERA